MNRICTQLHTAQQDVYADQLLNKESPHYNIGGYIRLSGHLDKEKFHEAVNSAANVFDAFKMRFDLDAADSKCYIADGYDKLELSYLDFSQLQNPSAKAIEWMQNRFNTCFIIKLESLLFEHSLIKISENEYWFFGRYHHLITDGFGFIVFVQYVAGKYKALASGEETGFTFPSYIDEIEKVSGYATSSAFRSDREYWEKKISDKPEKIFKKKYRPQNNSGNKSSGYVHCFSETERSQLEEIQLASKSGLQQLTIAAMLIYFGKISDQSEFIFGIPVHKRSSRVLRSIVGMFSGILPFKGTYDKDFILSDLLKEITQTQKNDYRHQNYSMSEIIRSLKERTADDYLFEISVNYEPLNFELDFGNDINASLHRLESDQERNPLQLFWREYGNRQPLKLIVNYGSEYFNQEEIELFVQRILSIIKQFPGALDRNIGSIKLLTEQDNLLLRQFNDTGADYPDDKNIVTLFEEQVLKFPERTALIFEEQTLTYKELNERSNRLAHYLLTKGINSETLVPICIERSIEMLVGILGILKAGGAYVPIDPDYPADRIKYILEDTNAKAGLSSKKCLSKLHPDTACEIILTDDDRAFSKLPEDNPGISYKKDQLAYVIYTSGTTGRPKGVMIEHRSVVNLINAQSRTFKISSDDRILQFSNYCFDASVEQILLALLNGAALVLFREGLQLSSDEFENFLTDKKISHLHATPSFLENLNPINSESLKRVIAGGEVCKKELSERWKNNAAFYNEYGPTETTVTAVEYSNENDFEKNIFLPVGKPLSNIKIYISNNSEELCPVGIAGEIFIGGDCLSRGYLNSPELTSEKFIKNPFNERAGSLIYRTGDIGRWLTDGNIEFLGRKDDQVKIRGYRIEPGEIESVLNECAAVSRSVVIAWDDNGNMRLAAYVIPEENFDSGSIQTFLRKKLPEYMIPSVFIEMENFPLTSNGKIDKKALPLPELSGIITNEYSAPENELEEKIAVLWSELLNVEKPGINDSFFELGGHSLNAIQLVSRLHKQINIKTDIGTIFSNPTIRKLSRALSEEKQIRFAEIKKLPGAEFYELSHAQKRYWILSKFKNGSEAYNVSSVFTIDGNLNINAFKKAFETVIERHEILRTVFIDSENGVPMQKIISLKETCFKIEETDIGNESDSKLIIKKYLEENSRRPFDLMRGPLIRGSLFREPGKKFIFVFSIHHIISDGWSKGIFVNEFLNLYNSYSTGEENNLAPLSIQYKDYAAWHNASFGRQGLYWRELYGNGIPEPDFPSDFERPKVLSYFGEMLQETVSESLTSKLHRIAGGYNMSLNNLLLILYGLHVSFYGKQEEVVIGTVSSGRSHPDLENLIGVFINFLPVKLSPKRFLKLSEYISKSFNEVVQAYSNQDYPFDLMVEDNIKKRDVSRNPFFDTMINFQIENNLTSRTSLIKHDKNLNEDMFQSVLDFKLDVVPADGILKLYLSYNSKIYARQRMGNFLNEFTLLLEKISIEPDEYLSHYRIGNMQIEEKYETALLPVNVCSSFVIEPVQEFMEYWNKELEMDVKISFAPYNQVFQQLLDPGSLLNRTNGINILFIRPEDWIRDQKDFSISEQIEFLNKTNSELINCFESIRRKTLIPYLTGIVPVNTNSSLNEKIISRINYINKELRIFFEKQISVQMIDLNEVASLYDISEIYDAKTDEIAHMPFTPEYYAALGTYLMRRVSSFINPDHKVIVLDCDNTLWKGICGETGALNVKVDDDYSELQNFILEKYNEGFLIALCSKNNEEDVWEVFESNPDMKIRREHISAYRINWEPKPGNIESIAKELNLGMNSMIFIDDNEFETEQVELNCPEVLSLKLPDDPGEFLSYLHHIWAFDHYRITDEDRKRNEMYRVDKQRKEEENKFDKLSDFLNSLDLNVDIRPLELKEIERAVQLSLRTNQFNLNGIRKTSEEIIKSMSDENSIVRLVEVKDRFGDYGIVGLVIAKVKSDQKELVIETFLLSCRVLGRNVEGSIMKELQDHCISHGLNLITANFKPTLKNKPFQEFLSDSEWVKDSKSDNYFHELRTAEQIYV